MNAINHQTLTDPAPAPATTPVDLNIFAGIHKAIRRGLADLLGQLGTTDFDNASALGHLGDGLESLLAFCEDHLAHEETVARPACGNRLVPEAFDRGHPQHLRFIAEIRALFRAVQASSKQERPGLAHALYLHFSVFMADCLEHMAEEERVLLPLMLKALGEKEVLAIRERILASMAPAALAEAAGRMLSACNATEQRQLLLGILAKAPRAAAVALVRSTERDLDAAAFVRLMNLVEASPAAV
jgi:hypothetical protein